MDIKRPAHLGAEYARQFCDRSVAEAYPTRPPYPDELFETLASLISKTPAAALDIGCGTGDLARRLVEIPGVERVDAVDFSLPMLEKGRELPNGDHPHLRWIAGAVESAPLTPPYALITAGESLHWMDWRVVFPRFREILTSGGYLAVVVRKRKDPPWSRAVGKLCRDFSTNREYQPYDLIELLTRAGLFEVHGSHRTARRLFEQSVEDYIESYHSRNGFSRERMTPENAAEFDHRVRDAVTPHSVDGRLAMQVYAKVTWGCPTG